MSSTLINNNAIPIIDMAYISHREVWPIKACTRQSAHKLYRALVDTGLALLVNHGIAEMKLQQAYRKLDYFCSLPESDRKEFEGAQNSSQTSGYHPAGPKIPGQLNDYKHVYNVKSNCKEPMPTTFINNVGLNQLECIFDDFKSLASTLMQFIAIGIGITPKHFRHVYDQLLRDDDESLFQLIYYPPTDDRIHGDERYSAEKTENGMFVLIAQDAESGLQVLQCKKWVTVGYLPGAILLICGNLLKVWTEEMCVPVPYRFTIPVDINIRSRSRHCAILASRIPPTTIELCPAAAPPLHVVTTNLEQIIASVENLNDNENNQHLNPLIRVIHYIWAICRTPCKNNC
uniref:Putative iron/ascorbate family oxidoreductase n=1 Tax=Triatoma dimidiata TaxID=72491 RepID=A0A0V0G9E1_TRIDM